MTLFLTGCVSRDEETIAMSKEQKELYVLQLKEKILKVEAKLYQLKVDARRLAFKDPTTARIFFHKRIPEMEYEIEKLEKEINYLNSIKID